MDKKIDVLVVTKSDVDVTENEIIGVFTDEHNCYDYLENEYLPEYMDEHYDMDEESVKENITSIMQNLKKGTYAFDPMVGSDVSFHKEWHTLR